ncbi:MAG: Gfo/Idh/MocA family protein [Acidimicrobiia bacterium]
MPSYALAGSGTSAAIWAQTITSLDGHELRSVHGGRADHAERLAAGYGAAVGGHDDLGRGVDVAVVASAPPAHAADALRAVGNGAAALVEAPLCATLTDADALVEAVAAGAHVAAAEHLLFSPLVRDAVRRVRELGPLSSMQVRVLQQPPVRRTALDARWGGGVLFDLGAHPLAVLLTMVGTDRPVSVSARLAQADTSVHAVDDLADVRLQLASGARCALELSWRASEPQWDLQVATPASTLRLELLPDPHVEQLGVDLPRPPRRHRGVEPAQLEVFGYLDQVVEHAADLAAGRPPYVDVHLGRYVLDVICAAYRSAGTGEPEPLPFTGPRDRTPWQLWREP